MPGLTAWVGTFDLGRPQPGETVFVSAAAGAVGSLVGQFARLAGARAVGSAGSADKVAHCVDVLGYDAAFDYRTLRRQRALVEALRDACPAGDRRLLRQRRRTDAGGRAALPQRRSPGCRCAG